MSKKTVEGLLILIVFAALWVPFGQTDFLITHWMKVGSMMLPFIIFIAVAFQTPKQTISIGGPKAVALALLAAYILHQHEEHWIDIFGNVYAFQGSINALVASISTPPPGQTGPLTAEAIFVINTSLVWLVGLIAIWQAPERRFPSLALAAIVLVNALVHIAGSIVTVSYNPGLLTSILVFLPIAFWAYLRLAGKRNLVLLSLAWAVLAHIIMGLGMMASTWWGLIAPLSYYFVLVVWSLVPLAVRFNEG
ncbi:MAG: HXXEE domain-containing protein [Pseudomonadota bacterium]